MVRPPESLERARQPDARVVIRTVLSPRGDELGDGVRGTSSIHKVESTIEALRRGKRVGGGLSNARAFRFGNRRTFRCDDSKCEFLNQPSEITPTTRSPNSPLDSLGLEVQKGHLDLDSAATKLVVSKQHFVHSSDAPNPPRDFSVKECRLSQRYLIGECLHSFSFQNDKRPYAGQILDQEIGDGLTQPRVIATKSGQRRDRDRRHVVRRRGWFGRSVLLV